MWMFDRRTQTTDARLPQGGHVLPGLKGWRVVLLRLQYL